MSTTIIILTLGAAGLLGIGIGYVLRLLVALGQKGSAEIQIKQKLLEAREEAKKIVEEGEKKAAALEAEFREELRLKEEALTGKDERIGQKEAFLDKRQLDIDREADRIKAQIEEV